MLCNLNTMIENTLFMWESFKNSHVFVYLTLPQSF